MDSSTLDCCNEIPKAACLGKQTVRSALKSGARIFYGMAPATVRAPLVRPNPAEDSMLKTHAEGESTV